ncbi:MAG: methyltransferase domain-containing protein [Actinomycetota bacterium]
MTEGVDVREVMDEIQAEVARKRAEGLYPPDVVVEIDTSAAAGDPGAPGGDSGARTSGVMASALVDLQRSSHVSGLVTTASRKPVIAPLISQARRAIRSSLTWYMNGILEQVNRFNDNTVRSAGLLSERTNQLDARIDGLERRLAAADEWQAAMDAETVPQRLGRLERAVRELRERLEEGAAGGAGGTVGAVAGRSDGGPSMAPSRRAERSFDYLAFENRFRGDPEVIADRQRHYVDLFREATLPVVDLGCGRGEMLGLLAGAGVPCYGVDRHPDMVAAVAGQGLEVIEADTLAHLASLERGSLGGIFCAQMVEHLAPAEVPSLFDLAADALAPGAPLVVETINPESLFVFAHAFYVDLGHSRPLHPLTLEFLAREAGFSKVELEYMAPPPPEFRPQPVGPVQDGPLAPVVASLDENFRRIDDILFGPQDFAVVAHR